MRWLSDIPMGLVKRCARMLPRLRAEEALERIEQTAVGSGAAERGDQRMILDGLRLDIGVAARAPRMTRGDVQNVRAIGIGTRLVPKAAE